MNWAKGYKTYATAVICALIGADHALIADHVAWFVQHPIPDYVTWALGAFGLYSVRSAITTSSQTAVANVLAQIAPQQASMGSAAQQDNRVPPAQSPSSDGTGNADALKAAPDNLTFNRTLR